MTYQEAIDYLYNQLPMFSVVGPGAYKPGLDTARDLAAMFGNPERRLRCIHVGGTNGKGSTSHSIAAALMAAGHRVGLYTSPHLVDFRERIRVDGEMISREAVVEFLEKYLAAEPSVHPSFFELTTIMAFDWFARQQVDYAVIEVGLGGRLDTTNIITPVLSVITNISLDHTALLGDTPEQIAREKAGIIKPGVPVVIGEADDKLRQVFTEAAAAVGAPITFAEDMPMPEIPFDLEGPYQDRNLRTVATALSVLGVPDKAIAEGLANVRELTHLMGRWMVVRDSSPRVICDIGHNIGAWRHLAPRLASIPNLSMVIGFVNDKDLSEIMPQMPRHARYYFVTPSIARGRNAAELLELARPYGLQAQAFASVADGYNAALCDAAPDGTIFVGGSNFVVADLLAMPGGNFRL